MSHPARFSKEVIDVMVEILQPVFDRQGGEVPGIGRISIRQHLHDPFAGTGERLAELSERLRPTARYSGTEIEPEFIVAPGIVQGDATDKGTYPFYLSGGYIIVTSPSYPNGMSDSWEATDESKRKTYRAALKTITGVDRQLHENNMGRYGYRGTSAQSSKRAEYWNLADRAVANWGGASMVLVNVSDFLWSNKVIGTCREPVVYHWAEVLRAHGWVNQTHVPVGTRRMKHGANRDVRVDHEVVIVGTKE